MSRIETEEVRPVRETLRCDCGGELKHVRTESASNSVSTHWRATHRCSESGESVITEGKGLAVTYPRIVYVGA